MFITADQLLAHMIGDYILQSHQMAESKTKSSWAALAHVTFYSLPFFWFEPSGPAYLAIVITHFLIDRFRLARYVVFAKNNFLATDESRWCECQATGYPERTPAWLSVWLLIIADNVLHVICNGIALKYL